LANFYEKALFVKPTVAAPLCGGCDYPLPFALCFYSHSLGELSLWWLGALWDPSFRAKGAAIFLAVSPPHRGSTKFATCAVAFRSEARSGEISRGHPPL
jgi:hypothetical protein